MEQNTYKTIKGTVLGEIVVKKSRFICEIRNVENVIEAGNFIAEIKKKYFDAKHHCSAYVIGVNGEVVRANDDGEPSGTAGKPMLEILQGAGLTNVEAVITRYFGGTLLGTGGLVRAYSDALNEALSKAEIVTYCKLLVVNIKTDYSNFAKIQNFVYANKLFIKEPKYNENVECEIYIPFDKVDEFKKNMIDLTSGAILIKDGDVIWSIDKY